MAAERMDFDSLETEVLIRYVVSEAEFAEAVKVAERFRYHKAASGVLRTYYATLPDAREEMLTDLRIVEKRQGTYLFAIKTTSHCYLYVGSEEESMYLGEYENGLDNKDILFFFGFKNGQEFSARLPVAMEDLPAFENTPGPEIVCIACGVTEGNLHILGCMVELCPWCDGQLSRCNCRFEQLEVDQIDDEEELDRFEVLLEQKGRIVFRADQNPAYPVAGEDRGPGEDR